MDPQAYDLDGFVVVRDLFTPEEAAHTEQQVRRAAGTAPFFQHGVVARIPTLWPILVHRGLLQEVAQAVGASRRCLPGIDSVGVDYAEEEPHRDVSPDELPCLAGSPTAQRYDVVRVISYPSPGPSLFGALPGSHLLPGSSQDVLAWTADSWRWLALGPQDAVLFDPRLVHAGRQSGRRVMVVVTYGGGGPGTVDRDASNVNGQPHMGRAPELVQADVGRPPPRQLGDAVHFQTGTDDGEIRKVRSMRKARMHLAQAVKRA